MTLDDLCDYISHTNSIPKVAKVRLSPFIATYRHEELHYSIGLCWVATNFMEAVMLHGFHGESEDALWAAEEGAKLCELVRGAVRSVLCVEEPGRVSFVEDAACTIGVSETVSIH